MMRFVRDSRSKTPTSRLPFALIGSENERPGHGTLGIASGSLVFFTRPSRVLSLIAVDDIGAFAELSLSEPETYAGKSLSLAGDTLTGPEVAAAIGRATGRTIAYAEIPAEVVQQDARLERIVRFGNRGDFQVDVAPLRQARPELLTFDAWLARTGKGLFDKLLAAAA